MSFIKDYMLFASNNEVAENYHFWSALSALSAIVNRQVWISLGMYNLFPNLYVILLGQPGSGKDFAMNISQDLIDDVGDINFSGDAQTKESLVRFMRDTCPRSLDIDGMSYVITPITIYATELSHLLGPNSGHMIDFLTTIYTKDRRYSTRTKNKGDDLIERPFVSLLAGTTQEWITTYLKSDIIGGGFTRRVIFVNEPPRDSIDDKTRRKPFLVITDEQREARKRALIYATQLKSIKGEFKWSPAAKSAYEEWYRTREIPKDFDTAGYYQTKPNQVIKVAMLISLSESFDCVLRIDHWETAMALLERTELTLTRVFQGIGRNELNAIANRVLEILHCAQFITFKDTKGTELRARALDEKKLRGLMFRDAPGRECDDIINHLITTEHIFRQPVTTNNIARQFIVLRNSVVPGKDQTNANS